MNKYRFLRKGLFESQSKFEKRLNEETATGWRAVSLAIEGTTYVVLLEHERPR